MWPFGQKKNDIVTIALTPNDISFCVFEEEKKESTRYKVKAYNRIPLQNFEHTQSILFNPTAIKKQINNFFTTNNLENSSVALSVSGPTIFEEVVQVKNASPEPKDFNLEKLQILNWNSLYLCPSQKEGFDFFLCGMKPEHLFSYQLLGLTCNLNMSTIVTEQLAQLYLYKSLKGKRFRQTELSHDLMVQQYNLYNLCHADQVEQAIELDQTVGLDFKKEQRFLKTHLGLFLSKGK